jgi:hypothetical protein
MGGLFKKGKDKSSSSSTSTTTLPPWLEEASQEAIGKAKGIADRPWEGFGRDPVAELSEDEQAAIDLGREQGSAYQPLYNKSEDATDKANVSWLDADREAYMNPYAEAALEPSARKLREEGARDIRDAGSRSAMSGAFGGSRATLLETETAKNTNQNLSDLYTEGFAKNYEDAYSKFEGDRDNWRQIADQYRNLGGDTQQSIVTEMDALLKTGGLDRALRQAGINFDYAEFKEARDWDAENLKPLLEALSRAPHSSSTSSTGESTKQAGGGGLSDILGLASTVVGLYTGMGGKNPFGKKPIDGSAFAPPTNAPGG